MFELSTGAILYTMDHDELKFLVIRDFHGNYGFPKGHTEENETYEETALREIREEVGLDVKLDTSFEEELNYIMPNGIAKRSIYYLASYEDQIPVKQEEEVQEILLLPYEKALEILTFDNMKEVLVKAQRYIDEKSEFSSGD
ncbi:MAG: NUDIX domain-containing protein [Erysipelotrichaceae bacterium]|nr:NUDIX domain-containing protein [Erysipelotrichaceae bacterium]